MNNNIKRWLISALISFATGFALVMVSNIDTLTLDSFKNGSWVGFLFVAMRAGFKALAEGFIAWRKQQ